MDYQAAMLNPIYVTVGVPCVLSIGSVDHDLTALDKTVGTLFTFTNGGVETVVPAAVVRMRELAALGVLPADVDGATLALNGSMWTVNTHEMKPSPKGEADGEVYLLLKKKRA
ncbi:hypothetical protein JQ608_06670 [Bradyrhizobium liaoningense]|uniref:hypothetical protein n=1 Tax=Bradyrhizobium liaoningense TaxID=43992 RepID=UPI001BA6C991|nr:hypothetical protein [Bradyrhizobium liaoningense]MBR0876884.1 hypothetical protein [Bradyrhizobium liaoningense]